MIRSPAKASAIVRTTGTQRAQQCACDRAGVSGDSAQARAQPSQGGVLSRQKSLSQQPAVARVVCTVAGRARLA